MIKVNSQFSMKKTFLFTLILISVVSFAQDSETTAENQKAAAKTKKTDPNTRIDL
ncbi:hypothetical protein [Flavobacterium chungangense]|uniref:Uncharacterized protein n=1 Tax=Flavobacterium chungangense TaxID=554283 RepID=A0A6V6YVY5_9FLAO|nr:hypothetical protein [Flavobacterium chungangense]CAD0003603.1 hypothetical protein FLACHUCJ7_01491 [Flavobacterium chungangense]